MALLLPILGGAALGLGALAWYENYRRKAKALPGGLTVSKNIVPGKPCALNVYLKGGYTPATLLTLLANDRTAMQGVLRQPANVASNVSGTGYTFADVIDQWIVYAQGTKALSLPLMLTTDGKNVEGVIVSAIDMSAAAPASALKMGYQIGAERGHKKHPQHPRHPRRGGMEG